MAEEACGEGWRSTMSGSGIDLPAPSSTGPPHTLREGPTQVTGGASRPLPRGRREPGSVLASCLHSARTQRHRLVAVEGKGEGEGEGAGCTCWEANARQLRGCAT